MTWGEAAGGLAGVCPPSSSSAVFKNSGIGTGLKKYASTSALITSLRVFGSVLPVIRIIFRLGFRLRARFRSSKPEMPGK